MISNDAIMCYACGHRLAETDAAKKVPAVATVKRVLKKRVF